MSLEHEKRLSDLEKQLSATDSIAKNLLEGIDRLITSVDSQSKEITTLIANYKNQEDTNKRFGRRMEKLELKQASVAEEVIGNRTTMKVMDSMSLKLIWIGLTLTVLVGAFAYKLVSG